MKSPICFPSVLALLLGLYATSAVHAGIVSVTGAGVIISAPLFIGDTDNPLPTDQQGFNERQGVHLIAPLLVDSGAIPGGLFVDSHMIFFNQSGTGDLSTTATWTFSGEILGVMSNADGTLEAASSPFLGSLTTSGYPAAGFPMRGIEAGSPDGYSGVGTPTLTVTMTIAQPGDWIRVITRANVPDGGNGLALLSFGLLSLVAARRVLSKSAR